MGAHRLSEHSSDDSKGDFAGDSTGDFTHGTQSTLDGKAGSEHVGITDGPTFLDYIDDILGLQTTRSEHRLDLL